MQRAPNGHSNETFFVDDETVLRRSWPGKPAAKLAREARLLDALPSDLPTPRLISHHDAEQRFRRLPGAPPSPSAAVASAAMAGLGRLHGALAAISGGAGGSATEWLHERLAIVAAAGPRNLPPDIAADFAAALDAIERWLSRVPAGASQWLHGDYHLGNLLFVGDTLTGIVDFDDCGRGAAALEAAFALYAISRHPGDARFTFDATLWQNARAAYPGPVADDAELLFCAEQTLIHLAAAQRRAWPLTADIGFYPVWRALLG